MTEVLELPEIEKAEEYLFDFIVSKEKFVESQETELELVDFSIMCYNVSVVKDFILSCHHKTAGDDLENADNKLKSQDYKQACIITYNKDGSIKNKDEFEVEYIGSSPAYSANKVGRMFLFRIIK